MRVIAICHVNALAQSTGTPALANSSGVLSTVAGADLNDSAGAESFSVYGVTETALQARLHAPSSVCVDPSAVGRVLVASTDTHKCIRRLAPASGEVTVVAGALPFESSDADADASATHCSETVSLPGRAAVFSGIDCLLPAQLCDSSESLVYVSSMLDGTVRSFNPRTRT